MVMMREAMELGRDILAALRELTQELRRARLTASERAGQGS